MMPTHKRIDRGQTLPTFAPVRGNETELVSIRKQLIEIRELLVELLHHHGHERAGSHYGALLTTKEKLIRLDQAIMFVWGKSVTKDKDSARIHTEILQRWATSGMNGVVLETSMRRGKWVTSREAVERFQHAVGFR